MTPLFSSLTKTYNWSKISFLKRKYCKRIACVYRKVMLLIYTITQTTLLFWSNTSIALATAGTQRKQNLNIDVGCVLRSIWDKTQTKNNRCYFGSVLLANAILHQNKQQATSAWNIWPVTTDTHVILDCSFDRSCGGGSSRNKLNQSNVRTSSLTDAAIFVYTVVVPLRVGR